METLDLHHTRHHMVRSKLIEFIEVHWGKDVEAQIITGNSSRMKELVIEILDEYKLEYREGDWAGINNGFIKTDI